MTLTVDDRELIERMMQLSAATKVPAPAPLPEQTSRAVEAMAGVEDQRRQGQWRGQLYILDVVVRSATERGRDRPAVIV